MDIKLSKSLRSCPICGREDSLEFRSNIHRELKIRGYDKLVKVGPLEGTFCSECDEGFYTKESVALRSEQLKRAKEKMDLERVR